MLRASSGSMGAKALMRQWMAPMKETVVGVGEGQACTRTRTERMAVVRGVKDRNVDDGGVKRPSGRGCVRSKGCVYMGPRGRAYAHGLEGGCVCVSSLQDRGHWVAGRHEFEQTSEGGGGGAG